MSNRIDKYYKIRPCAVEENYEFLEKLESSQTLVDVLMSFEDFLDSLDLYAFQNWFKGEIIEGPVIERYWVTVALKYNYRDMPDPYGAKRLLKNGAKVKFIEAKQEIYIPEEGEIDFENGSNLYVDNGNMQSKKENKNAKPKYKKIWVVIIELPRRFVEDVIDQDLEEFEEHLDIDDISDARDDGMHDESEYDEESGQELEDGNEEEDEEEL